MSHYIALKEITDEIITAFIDRGENLEKYMDKCVYAFNDLAYRKGVTDTAVISTDDDTGYLTNFTCREWCIAWIGYNVCRDNIGKVGREVDPTLDKYRLKAQEFLDEMAMHEKNITFATITGREYEAADRISTAYIVRG